MVVVFSSLLTALLIAGGGPWPDLSEGMKRVGGGGGDAAVVVGVEDYTYLPDVVGAKKNSFDWYRYLTKVRGVPDTRVFLLEDSDATPSKIGKALSDAASQVQADGTLWFVFIGHGASSPDGADGVLVGKDAHADVEDFYPHTISRSEVLSLLAQASCRDSVAILDACFSGRSGSGGQLISGAQFLVPLELSEVAETTVLSAGRAKDIAGALPGAQRPAFSYLVLGALMGWGDADGNRQVTASEAVLYAWGVIRVLEPGRNQEPQLSGDDLALGRPPRNAPPDPDLAGIRGRLREGGVAVAPPPQVTGGGPTIQSGTATAAVADVAILAEPKKVVRLEVTPPKGKKVVSGSPYKNRAGEPGTWTVKAQAAGYDDYEATFHAPVDDVTVHRITLKKLGGLEITGTPAGASVTVTGPGGFSHTGAMTWKASGLRSGTYQVLVSRKGYVDEVSDIEVLGGKASIIKISLQKVASESDSQGSDPFPRPEPKPRPSDPSREDPPILDTIASFDEWMSKGNDLRRSKPAEAVTYYLRALDMRPDHPEVNYKVGDCYYRMGSHSKAITYFDNSISTSGFRAAFTRIAQSLAAMGKKKQAVKYLEEGLKLYPGDALMESMLSQYQ